jgi:hypothetical protein
VGDFVEHDGCLLQERCSLCNHVFFRNFDVGGCGFKETPRPCDLCGGQMFDMVLDWEDALPERDFDLARRHAMLADVSLALGTSMRVHPAATIPLLTVDKSQKLHSNISNVEEQKATFNDIVNEQEAKKLLSKPGSLALVNLQPTPYDKDASVRVRSKADAVMAELMRRLEIPIPDFVRNETFYLRQSAGGLLTVATDKYVGNCLFCSAISVTFGERKLELQAPQPRFEFDVSAAELGSPIHVVILLNANATLQQVSMVHVRSAGESETEMVCEVVRKSFPVNAAVEDDDHWLQNGGADQEPSTKRIKK